MTFDEFMIENYGCDSLLMDKKEIDGVIYCDYVCAETRVARKAWCTAKALEREACAELCDQWDITPGRRLAELIRART